MNESVNGMGVGRSEEVEIEEIKELEGRPNEIKIELSQFTSGSSSRRSRSDSSSSQSQPNHSTEPDSGTAARGTSTSECKSTTGGGGVRRRRSTTRSSLCRSNNSQSEFNLKPPSKTLINSASSSSNEIIKKSNLTTSRSPSPSSSHQQTNQPTISVEEIKRIRIKRLKSNPNSTIISSNPNQPITLLSKSIIRLSSSSSSSSSLNSHPQLNQFSHHHQSAQSIPTTAATATAAATTITTLTNKTTTDSHPSKTIPSTLHHQLPHTINLTQKSLPSSHIQSHLDSNLITEMVHDRHPFSIPHHSQSYPISDSHSTSINSLNRSTSYKLIDQSDRFPSQSASLSTFSPRSQNSYSNHQHHQHHQQPQQQQLLSSNQSRPNISSNFTTQPLSSSKRDPIFVNPSHHRSSCDESIPSSLHSSQLQQSPHTTHHNLLPNALGSPTLNSFQSNHHHLSNHPSNHSYQTPNISSSATFPSSSNHHMATPVTPSQTPVSTKKRGFFGKLRKKASRGDLISDELGAQLHPPQPLPDDIGPSTSSSSSSKIKAILDEERSHPSAVPVIPTTTTSKKQRIRKLIDKPSKHHHSDSNNSHPNNPHNLLSKSSQSNLNGPNNHGLDGELIALDTNLDEMEGIIDRDHVMFQLRRNSSMSAGTTNNMSIPPRDALSGFNNTSSPPHPHPHQLHDSAASGGTLFADPFNPGRTLGLASTANGPTHHHPRNGTFESDRQVVDSVKQLTQDPSHQSPHLHRGQSVPDHPQSSQHERSGSHASLHTLNSVPTVSGVNGLGMSTNATPVSGAPNMTPTIGGAGWTAPESWAVNPLEGQDADDLDADESEDDEGMLIGEFEHGPTDGDHPDGQSGLLARSMSGSSVHPIPGSNNTLNSLNPSTVGALSIGSRGRLGSIEENGGIVGLGPNGTPNLSTMAPGSRRPSDTGGNSIHNGSEASSSTSRAIGGLGVGIVGGAVVNGKMGSVSRSLGTDLSKPWTIRISRSDGSFATLSCPLTYTTSEICHQLGRKLFNQKPPASYKLYIKERGLERVAAPNEKPLIFQRRRLEQAGYNMADRLDDVGRADYSYLIKFVYKEESLAAVGGDDDFQGNLEYVDLQARSIQAIPIFLFKHAPLLVSLNLSKNPKLDIPSDFIQLCTSLRELRLCYMGVKRVHPSIRQCPSLSRLDLSNNRIVDLEHARLDDLTDLMALKVHNNRLWNLPDYFKSFKSLRLLNISNNKFETLPAIVCEIESLVDLDISFNMITVLPSEIGQLKNLERFVFLANPISTIPSTFVGLRQLREIDCRRCMLGDIAIFSDLPKLKKLLCENNAVTILDGAFNSLTELNASHNSITRLLLVGTGATLVSLNVSHAKISSLGQEFFDALVSCESLNMDNNQIKSFSDSFNQLTNLRNFSMKNNQLTSLPDSIGQLQRLHTLDLANNNLGALPKTIWNCSQLIVLNASSNLIEEFPMPPIAESNQEEMKRKASIPSIKPIVVGGGIGHSNSNPSVSRTLPPLSKSLQELFLGDNGLGDNVFSPISLLSELRVLNLSFNDLYEIPSLTLSKCESLEELYLSGNSLTSLPGEDFENLMGLKTLFINGNKLQTLPAELGKIKHLESLDVSSNVLKYNVTNWPYDWNWNWNLDLQYLNLSGNKRLEIKPAAGNQQDAIATAKRKNLSNFNALRRLRLLGLMDVTLTTPSVPDESEDRRVRVTQSEVSSMGYGIADSMGREDYNVVGLDMVVSRFRNKDDESLFGLFDAHSKTAFAGGKLAKYLHDGFSAILSSELRRLREGESVSEALRRAFLNINRDYGNLVTSQFEGRRKGSSGSLLTSERPSLTGTSGCADRKCGASGVVVYVAKKTVYVANVGDALAVIAKRGGAAHPIAHKHDPFDSVEIERIRSAEGWVSQKGLVADEVEVSRSFGYFHVHPAINSKPTVQTIELSEDDELIIIANAGIWSHITYQAAVDVARAQNRKADPMMAAQKLRDLALSYGAESNLMVMVVALGDLFKAKRRLTYRGAGGAQIDEDAYGATRVAARRGQLTDAPGEKYLTLLDREVAPPTGMVALVFTDIRNSTSLWETNPGMQSAMRMHNQLLRRQLRAIGGYEVKTEGDAFMVSFPSVTSALLWCFTVQLELLREDWPQEILDSEDGKEIYDSNGLLCYRGLSVRMGIHWGNPHCEADPITRRMDYFGPMVNRSARISGEAKGGEITASLDVIEIVKTLCFDQDKEVNLTHSKDLKESNHSLVPLTEEAETVLDPATRRDVASIRKMGFGISEIGEKRLKGLEMPEFLSLIYPRALAGRLNGQGASLGGPDSKVDEVYEPTPRMVDVNHIRQLAVIVLRLEAVSAANVHAPLSFPKSNQSSKLKIHPHLLAYPIRLESTDEELGVVLENLIIRIENVISSLQLRSLGPMDEVLGALADALKLNPKVILHALETFGSSSKAFGLFG